MANKSRLTYIQPKSNFEMIPASIIQRYDIETAGIYCKLVRLSSGKSLAINFLSKTIGINERRMRKVIVKLEEDGYVTRKPLHDEKGKIYAWDYQLFAEPVKKEKRTQAGKPTLHENHQGGEPTKVENGEGIISNKDIIYNNTDNNCTINSPVYKEETDIGSAELAHAPSDEDVFVEKMKKRFPRIMKMEQPLTLKQAKDVKERFGSDLVQKILNEMENWKKLLKNNVSAYMTIIAWCEKEQERL
jgi:hypothetical protein